MPENAATILIPDISGYTEFMTTFELEHSAHAINMLIEAIVTAVGDEYEVAEIEGDAVLLIRKGPAPSRNDIESTCLSIFNAFHYQRKWMQQHTVCPCGACQGLINLTLKFIAHHGPVAEIKVGKFIKQSGAEMIVAHRLLKNTIDTKEYLLVTEKLLEKDQQNSDAGAEWTKAFEEYPAIGKVDYRYRGLTEARKQVPDPPNTGDYMKSDNASFLELEIDAGFRDVYMVVMNIPERVQWWPGLVRIEQEIPQVFIGNMHYCVFDEYEGTVTPVKMLLSDDGFSFVERLHLPALNLSVIYEYIFNELGEKKSRFCCRIQNEGPAELSPEMREKLFTCLKRMSSSLAVYCANMKTSLFEPALPKRFS